MDHLQTVLENFCGVSMSEVTNEMISAAHKVTMEHGDIVLSYRLLERVYLAMDALANHKKNFWFAIALWVVRRRVAANKARRCHGGMRLR